MSLEAQLAWPCPHLSVEEVVQLDSDRMSLYTRQPVAAMGQVRILVNDDFFIPREGVLSAAILSSSVSGPFDIQPGQDTITVAASSGTATLSFGVSALVRLTTDAVVRAIKRAGWSHVSATNENGYLTFVDIEKVGPTSFVKVSGTAAGALGFGSPCSSGRQWAAYGRQVYPGWDLFARYDTSITNRYPRFRSKIRMNPMLKVTYSMPVQRCLRCRTVGNENDFRFDAHGNMIFIQNEDLLYQAALKILLTDKGSNSFFPWYGTTIRERIGSKALSGVASVLSEDIRRSLAQMQALQIQQAKYQQVTFKERLYSVVGVDVKRHVQDPTTYLIGVTVQNASGQPISLNIVFAVPEVVALMGKNGLMLGTEAAGLGTNQAWATFRGDRNVLTGGQ